VESAPPPTRTVKGPHGNIEVVGEVPEHLPCAEGVKCGGCTHVGCRVTKAYSDTVLADGNACIGPLITAMVKAKWDEVCDDACLYNWDTRGARVTRIEFPAPDCWDADIESGDAFSSCSITSGGTIAFRQAQTGRKGDAHEPTPSGARSRIHH